MSDLIVSIVDELSKVRASLEYIQYSTCEILTSGKCYNAKAMEGFDILTGEQVSRLRAIEGKLEKYMQIQKRENTGGSL